MSEKKLKNPATANAIVWAALMIATALIIGGEISDKKSGFILMMQVIGWLTTDLAIRGSGGSIKSELACLKRRLGNTRDV